MKNTAFLLLIISILHLSGCNTVDETPHTLNEKKFSISSLTKEKYQPPPTVQRSLKKTGNRVGAMEYVSVGEYEFLLPFDWQFGKKEKSSPSDNRWIIFSQSGEMVAALSCPIPESSGITPTITDRKERFFGEPPERSTHSADLEIVKDSNSQQIVALRVHIFHKNRNDHWEDACVIYSLWKPSDHIEIFESIYSSMRRR